MPRTNLDDATAKALDLLPHDDPARSDPRLVRDAQCLEEIRATQETAADVWLATSPLRAAPPEVLSSIMSKVDARTPLAHRNVKFFPWLAASGWVAAAVAFILWPRGGEQAPDVAKVGLPTALPSKSVRDTATTLPVPGAPADRRAIPDDRRMREDLLRYQAQLHNLDEQGALTAPRVLSLHSPNALLPSAEEMQRRVTNALGWMMELEGGMSADPARLVIKNGWMPESMSLSDGEYVRHLNFPPNAVEDYALMVSGDGAYYDKANDMIWAKDENGHGYLGRRVTAEDNLSAYHFPDADTLAANRVEVRTEPEGLVVEDPMTNTAKVLIDKVKPPQPGYEQVVVWTDTSGNENRIPVNNPVSATTTPTVTPLTNPPSNTSASSGSTTTKGVVSLATPSITVLPSLAQAGTGRIFFSLPDSNGVKSFSLIELPISAAGVLTNTSAALQPKVIVSGDRRSKSSSLR
ncbi:hypothetical protein OKA04_21730 [Luteolibacter flavescens]|uniref:Uncharacterized protein n=1 Tax=Luteolibacter flavescens TaxID=1859460 RepID=A0ABT3FUV4_9BACT|nr:hypothetical protein [Luteolibacter flavescens]MCW1887373.1 hypothetical protein [Luteolibacter flavescens]